MTCDGWCWMNCTSTGGSSALTCTTSWRVCNVSVASTGGTRSSLPLRRRWATPTSSHGRSWAGPSRWSPTRAPAGRRSTWSFSTRSPSRLTPRWSVWWPRPQSRAYGRSPSPRPGGSRNCCIPGSSSRSPRYVAGWRLTVPGTCPRSAGRSKHACSGATCRRFLPPVRWNSASTSGPWMPVSWWATRARSSRPGSASAAWGGRRRRD